MRYTPGTKTALVLGAAGFIGHHLVRRLKSEGYWVRGVDRVHPGLVEADSVIVGDLRDRATVGHAFDSHGLMDRFDEVYQCAAEMGGMGYIHGGHDAEIMSSSSLININVLEACRRFPRRVGRILFTSSACVYPDTRIEDDGPYGLRESDAYPARCDSEYGWEKLYAERLYAAYYVQHGIESRVARLHNVYGPEGTWQGGREKLPAAMCRKVAMAPDGGSIEVWGDGTARRSFLFIDDCLDGLTTLLRHDKWRTPLNIGSERLISVDDVARLVMRIAGKSLSIKHVEGPVGVVDRNSDNTLVEKTIGWSPKINLEDGLARTYEWIARQVVNLSAVA